jgi:hypothetical protein
MHLLLVSAGSQWAALYHTGPWCPHYVKLTVNYAHTEEHKSALPSNIHMQPSFTPAFEMEKLEAKILEGTCLRHPLFLLKFLLHICSVPGS